MKNGYYNTILETVGNTPLVKLNRVTKGLRATVLAKVESFNPGGSVKDRIAMSIIEAAEKEGRLKPGGTIVESTSGNTGAGLALVAALKGYKVIFTMPDKMSAEKVRNLQAFGAEVIVTPTAVPPDSPESYYSVARKIAEETPNAILANQYFNPLNPEAHYKTTGPEIWQQTQGKVDFFVAGMGTGGTITGTGKFLKEQNSQVQVVGADPVGSILKEYFYSGKMAEAKPYKVEGVGEDIIPGTIDFQYIDDVIEVTDKESFNTARAITREEGIFTGGSGGLAACAALKAAKALPEDKTVVVLLPDSGFKYLTTFYSDQWMKENRFFDFEHTSLSEIVDVKTQKTPKLVSIEPREPVSEAISKMKSFNISQLPVLADGKPVGKLEENTLLGQIIDDTTLLECPVRDVMTESFPVLGGQSSISDARRYLSDHKYAAVLIQQADKIVGIITKSDILEFMV